MLLFNHLFFGKFITELDKFVDVVGYMWVIGYETIFVKQPYFFLSGS